MLAKRISQLQPDDVFIWGDANTRGNMCVSGKLLGPLRCVMVEPTVGKGHSKVFFIAMGSGEQDSRWYQKSDIAILSSGPSRTGLSTFVDYDVHCTKCGERYGSHNGLNCPDGRTSYFVPSQDDLENFHSEELRQALRTSDCDDFFDSIGL